MPQTTAGHPRRSLPEVLPLVSPCPKAPHATSRSPSVLTYGPVTPGDYSPRRAEFYLIAAGLATYPSGAPMA